MLPDNELVRLVQQHHIEGVPTGYDAYTSESAVQPGSLDLHIGGIFVPGTNADAAGGESHPHDEYLLNTGETVLVKTLETLKLPKDVGGFAFPPSRFAVKALLVTNGGHIDPEYSGPLRFTIINMGHEPQKLEVGQRVGTLVLFVTSKPVSRGWATRTGKPGRSPNTTDLHYLCSDFIDLEKRAGDIARAEVLNAQRNIQEVERRLSRKFDFTTVAASLFVAAVIAIFSMWSPVSKLDNEVDLISQQSAKASDVDQKLQKLATRDEMERMLKEMDSLEKRVGTIEKRGGR
jgi:dCTP deaminase